jgi:hypothetical protein
MSAGDDEVARAPNPRFALETAMVRLATLPQTLPVNELLERLERLEKKLAGEPVSLETPARGPVSTPSTPKQAAPATAPVLSGDKEQVWRDFVSAVRKEKKFLASHLDQAKVLELIPGRLSIGVAERHELSFLQDAENFAALKNIARSFFSAETAIEVKLVAERSAPKEQTGDGMAAVAGAERSDIVNEAVRIFGGTVRSVRRESGEG